MTTDPHDRLLAKAFGDLDTRPFAWCFDCDLDADVDDEQMTQYDAVAEQAARQRMAAAPQEPRASAGETYISSWGELLHAMTNGQMGTPPQMTLRRYEPTQQK